MATLINVKNAIYNTRAILNGAVGKYDYIRFIGLDEDNDNKRYYLTSQIAEGFYFKPANINAGNSLDTIKFVPATPEIEQAVVEADSVDLINEDGSFTRFSIENKTFPKRPSFQWTLTVKANEQDKRPII